MKELIAAPSKPDRKIIQHILSLGVTSLYCNPEEIPEDLRGAVKVYFASEDADVRVVDSLGEIKGDAAFRVRVEKPEDAERVLAAAKAGAKAVIVETGDWKIIPLENLVADLKPLGTTLIAVASSPGEVETLLGVLELGVDGVLLEVKDASDVDAAVDVLGAPREIPLTEAEVVEVKDVGMGERACVDTVAILGEGEGMLVGNTAALFLLVHNESIGSSFTSPRPFRVNAGAIHCYTLMPDGSTKYLSELSSGDRVLIASKDGARVVAVGRVKIERRPLRLVRVRARDVEGSITAQNAETIRFVRADGSLVSVTELKPGDKIFAHVTEVKGRHFGRTVEEFVLEK